MQLTDSHTEKRTIHSLLVNRHLLQTGQGTDSILNNLCDLCENSSRLQVDINRIIDTARIRHTRI